MFTSSCYDLILLLDDDKARTEQSHVDEDSDELEILTYPDDNDLSAATSAAVPTMIDVCTSHNTTICEHSDVLVNCCMYN